jgi:hypothetical protein
VSKFLHEDYLPPRNMWFSLARKFASIHFITNLESTNKEL